MHRSRNVCLAQASTSVFAQNFSLLHFILHRACVHFVCFYLLFFHLHFVAPRFFDHQRNCRNAPLRQYVIVMRGHFATQELLVLDLDIMVKVGHQRKRVSQVSQDVVHRARQFHPKVHRTSVTHDVTRGRRRRANTRPGGRGKGS